MAQFNFSDYQTIAQNQGGQSSTGGNKIGFFRLKNDGDEALVRINCRSLDDLIFASVHTVNQNNQFMKVSCLNSVHSSTNICPLCAAAAAGNKAVSKVQNKVYILMLASYRDKSTGVFSDPQPVVWERPAGFSKDIANKLRDYGPLTDVLLKITRNGVAGDMKTTYSLDYAVPTVFKPELIPINFSAFTNFNIARHSYWEKSSDEIITFINTGAFPSSNASTTPAEPIISAAPTPGAVLTSYSNAAPTVNTPAAPVQPTPANFSMAPQTPQFNGVPVGTAANTPASEMIPPIAPAQAAPIETTTTRNFTGFKF